MSPTPGRSTFNTSAPNHANNCVQAGPACTPVKSIILIPSRGRPMIKHSSFSDAAKIRTRSHSALLEELVGQPNFQNLFRYLKESPLSSLPEAQRLNG